MGSSRPVHRRIYGTVHSNFVSDDHVNARHRHRSHLSMPSFLHITKSPYRLSKEIGVGSKIRFLSILMLVPFCTSFTEFVLHKHSSCVRNQWWHKIQGGIVGCRGSHDGSYRCICPGSSSALVSHVLFFERFKLGHQWQATCFRKFLAAEGWRVQHKSDPDDENGAGYDSRG